MQCRTLMGNVIARFPAATLHACHVERVYLRSPLPWVRLRSLQVLSAVDSFVPKLVRVAHRHLPCPLCSSVGNSSAGGFKLGSFASIFRSEQQQMHACTTDWQTFD